jgi:hypothetical protein
LVDFDAERLLQKQQREEAEQEQVFNVDSDEEGGS